MKLIVFVLVLCAFNNALAQHISGKVIDGFTQLPLSNASVATSSSIAFTKPNGYFNLPKQLRGDTITVTSTGYKAYRFTLDSALSKDTLLITLQPLSLMLNQVTVKALRIYKLDSLKNRAFYSSVFNYKAPAFTDIFTKKPVAAYVPYTVTPNNTTEILSINVLSLIALAGKNKMPLSKLQKTLLKDEEVSYTNRVFSKEKVSSITNLKDDSLQKFMELYRPTIQQLKKMSAYDVLMYIKQRYHEFL